MTSKPLIILDRDGVINEDSADYIKTPDEWIPIPGSLEAIATLSQAGFLVHIATNQSGLARGYFNLDTLNTIHEKMHSLLAALGGHIDLVAFCPHGPEDHCDCRKPKPGLIQQCLNAANLSPATAFVLGDSWRDLQAAQSAGCPHGLVLTGNGAKTLKGQGDYCALIPVFADLSQAAQFLIKNYS